MKPAVAFFLPLLLLLPLVAAGQTHSELPFEYGGRFEFELDKKISKGLHLSLSEELRFADNFTAFNRLHTTVAMSYKLNGNLRVGVGYALINPYNTSDKAFANSRHRVMADAIATLPLGNWQLSLKERFQSTYRTGAMNEYQNPRTALTLKSRLKVSYCGLGRLKPFAYVELRHMLNAPVIKANYNAATSQYITDEGSRTGEAGWFLDGFNGSYLNRLRGALGADYRIDKRNSINVTILADRVSDKEVDANAEGTKLKSYTQQTGFKTWLACTYKYAF
ncbi:MAG: DUF2490 domain-containing protein [Bacteroidales bacterium]|nr:DUF2490 domain-containing protein [Bacteroidales bacterium]